MDEKDINEAFNKPTLDDLLKMLIKIVLDGGILLVLIFSLLIFLKI